MGLIEFNGDLLLYSSLPQNDLELNGFVLIPGPTMRSLMKNFGATDDDMALMESSYFPVSRSQHSICRVLYRTIPHLPNLTGVKHDMSWRISLTLTVIISSRAKSVSAFLVLHSRVVRNTLLSRTPVKAD